VSMSLKVGGGGGGGGSTSEFDFGLSLPEPSSPLPFPPQVLRAATNAKEFVPKNIMNGNGIGNSIVPTGTLTEKEKEKEKKKRIRVKKKRSPSFDATQIANFVPTFDPTSGHLKVQFTIVEVRQFSRDISFCAVPSDGSWPLGLGLPSSLTDLVSNLEAFEDRKEAELKMRANDLKTAEVSIV